MVPQDNAAHFSGVMPKSDAAARPVEKKDIISREEALCSRVITRFAGLASSTPPGGHHFVELGAAWQSAAVTKLRTMLEARKGPEEQAFLQERFAQMMPATYSGEQPCLVLALLSEQWKASIEQLEAEYAQPGADATGTQGPEVAEALSVEGQGELAGTKMVCYQDKFVAIGEDMTEQKKAQLVAVFGKSYPQLATQAQQALASNAIQTATLAQAKAATSAAQSLHQQMLETLVEELQAWIAANAEPTKEASAESAKDGAALQAAYRSSSRAATIGKRAIFPGVGVAMEVTGAKERARARREGERALQERAAAKEQAEAREERAKEKLSEDIQADAEKHEGQLHRGAAASEQHAARRARVAEDGTKRKKAGP